MKMHKCSKEEDINNIHAKIETLLIDIAHVQEENKSQSIMLNSIHAGIYGNGRPGLKEEMDKMKGGVLAWKWITGIVLSLFTIVLTLLKSGGGKP